VTIFADIRGVNVRGIFTRSVYAIVAGGAVAGYCTVIELGIAPRVGVVAVVASVRTLYVRGGFSLSNRSIVTGAAGAQYRVVINPRHILECRGRVTIFTDIGRVNVRGIFASGVYAVMARRTITADVGVIEGRISPRIGCMAIFT
jgi:hypothetical protein